MKPSITIQELKQLQADMDLVRNGNFNSRQYNILEMLKIIEQRKINENLKSIIDAIKNKENFSL